MAGAGIVAFFLLTPLSHEDVNGKHEHRGQGKALVIAETPQRISGPEPFNPRRRNFSATSYKYRWRFFESDTP